MRSHDVSQLPTAELERTRRDLAVSLALVSPDSPARAPILAQISAIDTQLAGREQAASAVLRVCGCGHATDSDAQMDGHLSEKPGHQERDLSRYQDLAVIADRS